MEAVQQVLDEVHGAWRFRWPAIALAWAVAVVGWVVVLVMPNVYEATARVYVDASTGLTPLLQGLAVQQDVDAQLNLVRQAMLGRPALEKVARETDLALKARTPEEMDGLLRGLRDKIEITNVTERGERRSSSQPDSLYLIRYTSSNRDTSLAVVRQLLDTFVEDTLGGNRSGSESAQRFLKEQVDDYGKRLGEAERALAEFKKQNLGLVPGQGGDYFTRIQVQTEASKQARADLAVAMNRRDELQRQLRGERQSATATTPVGVAGAPVSDTATRLAEAHARLDELTLRFTDKHPDVIATRETIRQLEARQAEELAAMRSGEGPATASLAASPVYQNIQMALNQTEVEIASLRSKIALAESNVADLRRVASSAPEVEAEYARLTRDYEVTKAQYNALLERLEKAKLSDQADQTGIVRFDVIDPPVAAFNPVAPNRPLLIAGVFLAALAAGGGLAYLLNMMKPVFSNSRALADLTGLPVLGAVTAAWVSDLRERRKKELLVFGGSCAGLLAICLILASWQLVAPIGLGQMAG
jgi:polysaccharide chain length determinant protein (PEP-CTERM system associated)